MTVEKLVEFMKDYLNHDDGQDYYAYRYEPHWYGDDEELIQLATALHLELKL